jgi:hypothetical protein
MSLREKTPTEFVTQSLEPLGGEILRPRYWHYSEYHQPSRCNWTISRERNANRTYTTGVKIQFFIGVKSNTQTSAEKAMRQQAEIRREQASKVYNDFGQINTGLFHRIGFEVMEGPFRVIYSYFWGHEMDVAAVTIAGTKASLWKTYCPVFEKMRDFTVIDPARFRKETEP